MTATPTGAERRSALAIPIALAMGGLPMGMAGRGDPWGRRAGSSCSRRGRSSCSWAAPWRSPSPPRAACSPCYGGPTRIGIVPALIRGVGGIGMGVWVTAQHALPDLRFDAAWSGFGRLRPVPWPRPILVGTVEPPCARRRPANDGPAPSGGGGGSGTGPRSGRTGCARPRPGWRRRRGGRARPRSTGGGVPWGRCRGPVETLWPRSGSPFGPSVDRAPARAGRTPLCPSARPHLIGRPFQGAAPLGAAEPSCRAAARGRRRPTTRATRGSSPRSSRRLRARGATRATRPGAPPSTGSARAGPTSRRPPRRASSTARARFSPDRGGGLPFRVGVDHLLFSAPAGIVVVGP